MSATSSEVRTGSTGRAPAFHHGNDLVERTGHRPHSLARNLSIDAGRVDVHVSQQDLNDADIDTLLEQVSGKRMPQCVRAYPLVDLGALGRFLHDAMQLAR